MKSLRWTAGAHARPGGMRILALTLVLGALTAVNAPSAGAQPQEADRLETLRPILTPSEAALVETATALRKGAQAKDVARLRKLSSDHAGEEVSGLAQVLVAKASLSLGRFDDAAEAARHVDIYRTSLGDRALLIL
ncbi:MAG: hypothetical protein KBH14_17260, partial [Vicinamibacteria bacterium]|nr:hypothetical protein [Vicinamibacteria bacterium]